MFNSPSSGYVLTPAEGARIYDEIPAVCATKEGAFRPASSRMLHELAPELVVWECDQTVYRAGWLRDGIVVPGATGHRGLPVRDAAAADRSPNTGIWCWSDKLVEAMDYGTDVRSGPVRPRHRVRGSPAIRGGRTTSRTGAAHSSTRRRCSACRSVTTRIPGRRRPSCPPRRRPRSKTPIGAWACWNCVAVEAITQRSGPGR